MSISKTKKEIILCSKDLPLSYFKIIFSNEVVACDIETSGLDFKSDRIATCQLYTPNKKNQIYIINQISNTPIVLLKTLNSLKIQKIFHHAMFDLRFMCFHWESEPKNVFCTKIASKLLDKEKKYEHHLTDLLERYLNIKIKKDQTKSNWFTEKLTSEQLDYAANDVYYLVELFNILKISLKQKPRDLWNLGQNCFNHIPTRVRLEVLGYDDIYQYG